MAGLLGLRELSVGKCGQITAEARGRWVDGLDDFVGGVVGGWVVGGWVLPGIDGLCLQRSSFFEA